MRGRPGTIEASRAKGFERPVYCPRCGIERKKDGRRDSLCKDCYQVDPTWGHRGNS